MAEVEATLATAPEVRPLAYWGAEIGPSAARGKIAILLAEAGHFAEVEQMAAKVARPSDRNRALREITVLLAQDGQVLRAFALLDAIHDPVDLFDDLQEPLVHPDANGDVVVVPSGAEERSAALRAVERAVDLLDSIDDPERRDHALFEAASLYLTLHEIDLANALMDQSASDAFRGLWLNRQVETLIETGDFAVAQRLADAALATHPNGSLAYWTLAKGVAKAGQAAEARRVLGRLADPSLRLWLQTQVVVILADINPEASAEFLAEAEVLAARIADPEERVNAMGWVGAAFAKTCDSDTAQALSGWLITVGASAEATSAALTDIASGPGDAGQGQAATMLLDAAVGQAALIGDAKDQGIAVSWVEWELRELGLFAEVERVAMRIDNAFDRGAALQWLGVALAESGEVSDAQRIAAIVSGLVGQDFIQRDGPYEIAEALALSGEGAAAEAVADSIVDPFWRANAMSDVAVALAAAGRLAEAERIARRVEDAAWRAVALAVVAARS